MDFYLLDISNSTRKNKMTYKVRIELHPSSYYNTITIDEIGFFPDDFYPKFDTYEEVKQFIRKWREEHKNCKQLTIRKTHYAISEINL